MSKLRFIAEYPRFGDPDPLFMQRVLQAGYDDGKIQDFKVLNILSSANGYPELEIIHFTVDIAIEVDGEWWGLTYDAAKLKAENLLNEIVHDSDVNVRYVGTPDPEAEAQYEAALLEHTWGGHD